MIMKNCRSVLFAFVIVLLNVIIFVTQVRAEVKPQFKEWVVGSGYVVTQDGNAYTPTASAVYDPPIPSGFRASFPANKITITYEKMFMKDVTSILSTQYRDSILKNDKTLWLKNYYNPLVPKEGEVWENKYRKIADDVTYTIDVGDQYPEYLMIKNDASLWSLKVDNSGNLTLKHLLDDVVDVSGTLMHPYAVKKDGSLWAVGSSFFYYDLVEKGVTDFTVFNKVADGIKKVFWISGNTMFVIREDDSLWRIGNGLDRDFPWATKSVKGTWVKVADQVADIQAYEYSGIASADKLFVVKKDGTLWYRGREDRNLKLPASGLNADEPARILPEVNNAVAWLYDGYLNAKGEFCTVVNNASYSVEGTQLKYHPKMEWGVKYTNVKLPQKLSLEEQNPMPAPPVPPLQDNPSEWAKAAIEQLKTKGIIPAELLSHYQNEITRDEFAAIMTNLFEHDNSAEIPLSTSPFKDIENSQYKEEIIKGSSIGLFSGTTKTLFSPSDLLTREQAAVFGGNYFKRVYGVESSSQHYKNFKDANAISFWAENGVSLAIKADVMKGTGENTFSPSKYLTREMAMVIANNLLTLEIEKLYQSEIVPALDNYINSPLYKNLVASSFAYEEYTKGIAQRPGAVNLIANAPAELFSADVTKIATNAIKQMTTKELNNKTVDTMEYLLYSMMTTDLAKETQKMSTQDYVNRYYGELGKEAVKVLIGKLGATKLKDFKNEYEALQLSEPFEPILTTANLNFLNTPLFQEAINNIDFTITINKISKETIKVGDLTVKQFKELEASLNSISNYEKLLDEIAKVDPTDQNLQQACKNVKEKIRYNMTSSLSSLLLNEHIADYSIGKMFDLFIEKIAEDKLEALSKSLLDTSAKKITLGIELGKFASEVLGGSMSTMEKSLMMQTLYQLETPIQIAANNCVANYKKDKTVENAEMAMSAINMLLADKYVGTNLFMEFRRAQALSTIGIWKDVFDMVFTKEQRMAYEDYQALYNSELSLIRALIPKILLTTTQE